VKSNKITFGGRRGFRRAGSFVLAAAMLLGSLYIAPAAEAEAADQTEYEIYPSPHVMEYTDGDYIIRDEVNVVYESGIDDATKDRLSETLALKSDISFSESDTIVDGMTNILVGIDGSGEYVDEYVDANITVSTEGLFDELDSYVLDSADGVIAVLGADTDASFYGLTTLYHIIKQMDSYTIRNFHIEDWADVASRGFIEGYYGEPWSTEDRANLMTWGGYYKLNSYFYAPKDDPKHNSNWRELYTDEEIEEKIKTLAEAGNASKCRFVYALHPFMYNAISFNSQEEYEADLAILQAKFEQVIEAGVRQIAILADDAANYNNTGNLGGNNYKRLLEDMSAWLKEMQKTYPDLKQTLPFCTVEYYGNGESYYADFPKNVQIVMTGGRIWGEVSDSFTTTFTNNAGRGPYMWINWPCTDNSKQHLIMGGYSTFLHPGVDPDKIQGIVLNPMQQSEPSKVAIFGNACYSWNIWESTEEADQAWNDSFKYVDHNSAIATEASDALRELSKHMINQNMDSRVTKLEESVELAPTLTAFKEKLNAGTVTVEDVEAVIAEFEVLQNAADVFEAQAGDTNLRDQMIYWLNCWDDTTDAAIAYLNGVKAVINNDTTAILKYNTEGKTAFDSSKTYAFSYIDHYEYAEVGVQHIVPFINALAEYVSKYAETAMNPDVVIQSFITNRTDSPTGSTDNVFDGDDGTMASYRNPVWLYTGDYVGVMYNRVIDINDFRFLLGTGKNHFEASKLQYTLDGSEWYDLELTGMDNAFTGVQGQYLEIEVGEENLPEDFQAMGIRLIATADNVLDAYLNVHEIQVNKNTAQQPDEPERLTGTVAYDGISVRNGATDSSYFDGDQNTEAQLAKGPYEDPNREIIAAGSTITITFDAPQTVGTFRLLQGVSAAADVFTDAAVQYQTEGSDTWTDAGQLTSAGDQTVDLGGVSNVTAVRILNNADTEGWVRIAEIEILEPEEEVVTPIEYNVIKTDRWTVYQTYVESNLYDGNDQTFVWYDPDGSDNTTGDDFLVDDFLGYDFGTVAELESAHIVVGAGDGDKIVNYAIETSVDGETWTPVEGYDNYTGAASGTDVLDIDLTGVSAQYIRIRNLTQKGSWGKFSEFTVEQKTEQGTSSENVYTNISTDITSTVEEGLVSLSAGNVVLDTDDYIGVKLNNIKAVTGAAVSELPENTVLETSMNGIVWTEYSGEDSVDARYVRVRSTADDVELNLTQFDVSYKFIGEKTVESDFSMAQASDDMRNAGTVNNVFDGDLSTLGMINGAQEQGKHITFDLGQVIHFSSIRYYVVETQLNYLRNAVFEVSADGEEWTEVLKVGQETANVWDDTTAKDMQDITLYHDSMNPGYMYAEATGLDVDGRYIRVTPVETYSHRWVAFNEIQINGGEYISAEANRDVVADAVEEKGKIPSNMFDGDFSTTYKSSAADSSFTYRLSEPEDVASIRLIQLGAVSNAEVTAKYIGEDGTAALGTLNQAINEFVIPEGSTLESITVTWADTVPEIAEISVSTVRQGAADKSELEAALAQPADEAWTTDSIAAYEAAWEVANNIYNNENASQTIVDSALGSLQSAYNNAEMKAANIDELQALVDGKVSNENTIYTSVTYMAYESAVNALAAALENADNLSQTRADSLKANVENAQAALQYSTRNRELAELEAETYALYNAEDYTEASYQVLTDAKNAIDALVAADKEAETAGGDRVNPQEFIDARTAFQNAVAGLEYAGGEEPDEEISTAVLEYAIELARDVNTDGVMEVVKENFEKALQTAEDVLARVQSGDKTVTQNEVDTAWQNLIKAMQYMEFKEADKDDLEKVIALAEEMNSNLDAYLDSGKEAFTSALTTAKEVYDDEFATQEEVNSAWENLLTAMANMMLKPDKGLLEDLISQAEGLNEADYEAESYAVVRAALAEAKEVFENEDATREEVNASAAALKAAMAKLTPADSSTSGSDTGNDSKDDGTNSGTSSDNKSGDTSGAVKTGDTANVIPIVIVLVICVAAVIAVVVIKNKKR
jgi:hyaluronoglucosaminidase